MQEVKFKNKVAYKGLSWITATGIQVFKTETLELPSPNNLMVLNLTPTNRSGLGSSELEIPIEQLGEVMLAMMKEAGIDPLEWAKQIVYDAGLLAVKRVHGS